MKTKYAWHMYSNVTCKFYIMSPCSAIISIKKIELRHIVMVHVCLFEFAPSTHGWRGERERKVCSFSWLRASAENFPSSPPLPAPTSCLHYSRVFQATPVTVETHQNTVVPFCRSSPAAADRWYGLRRVRSPSCARCR